MFIDGGDLTRVFSVASHADETGSTVIIGAGIIGCATAYYLSRSGHTKPDKIHLIEASPELFASSSGKAGGFLAADWFGPSTASLGALSFQLHKELAEKYDGRAKWGYSRTTGTSFTEGDTKVNGPRGDAWLRNGGSRAEVAGSHEFVGDLDRPAWLKRKQGDKMDLISEDGSTAQVDPLRLCNFLLRECIFAGVRLHQPAMAVKASHHPTSNELSALRIRHASGAEHKIPCTRLLIAAGAWTPHVFKTLFPDSSVELPITQLAGHSLVVKSPRWTSEHEGKGCHAVFSTGNDGFSPEIFSRVGEEIYIAGLNDSQVPLPELPTEAKIQPESISALKRVAERLLGMDGTDVSDLEVLREGLCFRPVTKQGDPIVGRVPEGKLGGIGTRGVGEGGVYVAAGHGPWGISQALGTGKVLAEMMEGRETSADVDGLGIK